MQDNPIETINCAEACVNGCVLGDRCPYLAYRDQTQQFIADTSLDTMVTMAEAAVRKKTMASPEWILPAEQQPSFPRYPDDNP